MSILALPKETLSEILVLLPVYSIINCAKACKYLKEVVYQDNLWRILCETIHGVDTINLRQYNGHWQRLFSEGKAPWINLENKRYILKNIMKAERIGECIEYSASGEDLVLNWTLHFSSSYSPSNTYAVGIMNTNNFQVKKIEGLSNTHFKKAGNYLLAFQMDQFSCIYPQGITTNNFAVYKYDPNNLPTSLAESEYMINTKSVEYAQEPRLIFNTVDPTLIYYASTLTAPVDRTANGPFVVEIFDLKTNSEKPIKRQKLLGNAYEFGGDYLVLTKSGKPEATIYLANWHDFNDCHSLSAEDGYGDLFDFNGKNVKTLKHSSEVSSVFYSNNLIACFQKNSSVTIWSTKESKPKALKTIDLTKLVNAQGYVSHFDGKLLCIAFNPTEGHVRNSCMIVDWQTEKEINVTISPKVLYFNVKPLYTNGGNYSGKMVLTAKGRTDILYTSTPYLAKKFDVAVLTSNGDKIIANRASTIFGHLAEDCKTLIGLSKSSSLTSQVLLEKGSVRYVLLFEEDVITTYRYDNDNAKETKSALTELLHLTVLSHKDHSPYGGIDFSGVDENKQNPSMRRATEVSVKNLRINGACLLMKEEQSEEFGWVPVNLEHNLEMLLGDITRDMTTIYNCYHGFI